MVSTPLKVAETDSSNSSISCYGSARSTVAGSPLSAEELRKIDAYWRACNYLAIGMIYLRDNPLLREPLKPEHIKNRLLVLVDGVWVEIQYTINDEFKED